MIGDRLACALIEYLTMHGKFLYKQSSFKLTFQTDELSETDWWCSVVFFLKMGTK